MQHYQKYHKFFYKICFEKNITEQLEKDFNDLVNKFKEKPEFNLTKKKQSCDNLVKSSEKKHKH